MSLELSALLYRRHPAENSHRDIIRSAHISVHLLLQIHERVEAEEVVKPLLIIPVTTFYLAVVPGSPGPDQLMLYPDFFTKDIKGMGASIFFGVCELGSVVGLYRNGLKAEVGYCPFHKIDGTVAAYLDIRLYEPFP